MCQSNCPFDTISVIMCGSTDEKGEAMESLWDIVKERRSVRTFNGDGLRAEDREKLEQYVKEISNPFI